jgi:hypothetical protein
MLMVRRIRAPHDKTVIGGGCVHRHGTSTRRVRANCLVRGASAVRTIPQQRDFAPADAARLVRAWTSSDVMSDSKGQLRQSSVQHKLAFTTPMSPLIRPFTRTC